MCETENETKLKQLCYIYIFLTLQEKSIVCIRKVNKIHVVALYIYRVYFLKLEEKFDYVFSSM